MPISQRRLVRHEPLLQRIKNYLDPWDWLLWLSEELESSDWDQWSKDWAISSGFAINFLMLVARASTAGSSSDYDDIFADNSGGGLLSWLASFIVIFLSSLSFLNAFWAFYRSRTYRLFEAAIDAAPSTLSARRVKVDSISGNPSPLRFLSANSAESRAHPDPQKDVWEISVWDPTQLSLRLFCLFSPGHVLIYWLLLPTSSQDTRPSTTVVLTMVLIAVLSFQLYYMQFNFSQQSKDSALIHKEVLNEYDVKFVHPRTHTVMRDAAVQCRDLGAKTGPSSSVELYQPVISKGFQTYPNPNYATHLNSDVTSVQQTPSRQSGYGADNTPSLQKSADLVTPIRQSSPAKSSQVRHSMGDGGSLSIYSHDRSPLKKAASQNLLNKRYSHLDPRARRESGKF